MEMCHLRSKGFAMTSKTDHLASRKTKLQNMPSCCKEGNFYVYELSESYFVPLQSVRVTNKNAF